MRSNDQTDNGKEQTPRRTATRRNELRALMRSRTVQAVLAGAVVAQGVATAREHAQPQTPERRAAVAQAQPAPAVLAPVVVAKAAKPAKKSPEQKALAMVEKYRDEGYELSPDLARSIQRAADEHGISPETAFGLIRAESGFRNSATSPVGAVGLTQLMPKTAKWLQPGVTTRQLRDPDTNLRIGFRYLGQLIEKYDGNERLALVAYNRGPGTVDRAIKRGRNPDNGYADFVYGKKNHGHRLFTR